MRIFNDMFCVIEEAKTIAINWINKLIQLETDYRFGLYAYIYHAYLSINVCIYVQYVFGSIM